MHTRRRQEVLWCIVAYGLSSLSLRQAALGAPPVTHGSAVSAGWVGRMTSPSETSRLTEPVVRSASSHSPMPPMSRLDLRPPTVSADAGVVTSVPFPSSHRPADKTDGTRRFPELGADLPQIRTGGRIQEMARRVQHDGVPLARLWENHSALLSLGLSPRGKPGLWLIQKTR